MVGENRLKNCLTHNRLIQWSPLRMKAASGARSADARDNSKVGPMTSYVGLYQETLVGKILHTRVSLNWFSPGDPQGATGG